jgi:DNA-binding winged helix-turn-helix (wHTH) protein
MSVPKFRQNISKFSVTSTALAPEPALHYFGPFRLSENERLLFCGDTEVRLKTKDLDVLLVLLKNRSRLVTKAELMEEVWPNSYVAEANLGVHIACLRKALRKHAPRHRYIETVHKYGYRFVETAIEESEESPVEVEERESLTVCPEAVLSLAGGLRIEARKSAVGTEVTMTIPKTVQEDGVTITSTPLGGTSCVRILFKNT